MEESKIRISPPDLIFSYTSKEIIPIDLKIINTGNDYIFFKVKTNSPNNYFVKPTQGKIEPSNEALLKISTRGQLSTKLPPSAQGHKFLINYINVEDNIEESKINWDDKNSKIYSKIMPVSFKPQDEDGPIVERAEKTEPVNHPEAPIEKYNNIYQSESNEVLDKHMHASLEIECVLFYKISIGAIKKQV